MKTAILFLSLMIPAIEPIHETVVIGLYKPGGPTHVHVGDTLVIRLGDPDAEATRSGSAWKWYATDPATSDWRITPGPSLNRNLGYNGWKLVREVRRFYFREIRLKAVSTGQYQFPVWYDPSKGMIGGMDATWSLFVIVDK